MRGAGPNLPRVCKTRQPAFGEDLDRGWGALSGQCLLNADKLLIPSTSSQRVPDRAGLLIGTVTAGISSGKGLAQAAPDSTIRLIQLDV